MGSGNGFGRLSGVFNQDAEILRLEKPQDECDEDYPAEYRKNIEEIFAISYEGGSIGKKPRGFSARGASLYPG